jgi:hypothetical protein
LIRSDNTPEANTRRTPRRPAGAPRRAARLCAAALALLAGHLFAAPTFTPDSQPTGWMTRPALTRYNITSGNEVVYRADYFAGEWKGELRANAIEADGTVSAYPAWTGAPDAGLLIASGSSTAWDTSRRIVTVKSDGTRIAFRWAQLSNAQKGSLDSNDTKSQNILNYVRGDRSNESPNGALYRSRVSLLGDIQHSSLLHWRHNDGSRRLYVGANDGMLHVFDAADGTEVFAYVPSMVIPRLKNLVANPYTHTLYVDGPLAIGNITLSGTTATTLLVGGLGGGGRGLFALDMTTPTASTEDDAKAKIKWEISNATTNFANLGFTYAAPRLARLNTGQAAVLVGNGYVTSGSGTPSLFLINASDGTRIREISAGSSTSAAYGLSTPTLVDTNGDGRVDYAYAGDLDGRLWKFDLTGSDAGAYSATLLHTTSPAQAITTAPVVFPHPLGGHMVMFGTGRMLNATDAASTATHYVYGLWDGRPNTNTSWLDQTLTAATVGSLKVRTTSANVPNWTAGGHMGWRLTLPAAERVVGENPTFNDDRLYFNSTNPTAAPSATGYPSGSNWLHEVNYLSGAAPPKSVFDMNGDNAFDAGDLVDSKVVAAIYLGPGVYSQPVIADMATRATTLFATNSDLSIAPPSAADPGVSGGHFDVDLYDRRDGTYKARRHVHEYDDKFDVVGVNFLAASDSLFNLANAISNTATPFKVLVMNQYLNPASMLSIGGSAFTSVKDYGILASSTDAATVLASLTTYSRMTGADNYIKTLTWKLPRDAFQSKDWWGDGVARAGLIPTVTGCVNKITNAATGATGTPGPNAERFNGALTIQLIRADTPASALELNYTAGGAKYGWRVKAANFSNVLAEYTLFWHHDNGKCYGQSGWTASPPQDFSGASGGSSPAVGSQDPSGSFSLGPATDGAFLISVTAAVSGDTTTYTYTYSDGSTATETRRDNGDGSVTITVNGETRAVFVGGRLDAGEQEVLNRSRRINWREVIAR